MMPFADLTATMNDAIVEFLADAVADFGEGVSVPGLFRNPPVDAFGLIDGSRPTFEATAAALANVGDGAAVSIAGIAYRVSGRRDYAGMVTLTLEEV